MNSINSISQLLLLPVVLSRLCRIVVLSFAAKEAPIGTIGLSCEYGKLLLPNIRLLLTVCSTKYHPFPQNRMTSVVNEKKG